MLVTSLWLALGSTRVASLKAEERSDTVNLTQNVRTLLEQAL